MSSRSTAWLGFDQSWVGNWISLKLCYCRGAAGTCGALGILLLVLNWVFSVVVVSRAGEKHLKEASFHLRWIWLVQAHVQFLLGQEITLWQPDFSGSCVCGYDHFAQVVHRHIFIFHPVQGMCMNRYSGMGIPSRSHCLCLDFCVLQCKGNCELRAPVLPLPCWNFK